MRLSTNQLRTIIKEELAEILAEHRTLPQFPEDLPEDFQEKIHALINSGNEEDIEMARVLMDSFGEPDYVDSYIDYFEVGTPEKLGNRGSDLTKSISPKDDTLTKIRYIRKKRELDAEAERKLKAIANRTGENYEDLYDRYVRNFLMR